MRFEKKYYYCIFSTLRNEESITLMALISCKNVTSDMIKISSRKEVISKDNSEAYFLLGKKSHQHILTHTHILSILSSYFCFICP